MARRIFVAALLFPLTVACGGVPTGGAVRVVRHVPAEGPDLPEPRVIRRVPSDPKPNAAPDEIVRGFLTAQAEDENDHAIARKYLVAGVAWAPGTRVTVYGNPRIGTPAVTGETATVAAVVDPVGAIDANGSFRPASSLAATSVTFTLRKVPGRGWRLATAPTGVLLTRDEVAGLFERVTLYWPGLARRLVPEQVFLPDTDQPIGALVRALLTGPRGWLAPAVRSAIPSGTELLEPPNVVDGVVSLNFSREIRRAPQEALPALVAQVVWTLTEPSLGIHAVRVSVEGDALTVPGHPQKEHRRGDWAEFAPGPADARLFFVRDGRAYALDDAGRLSRVGPATQPLAAVTVNHAGTAVAAVTQPSGGRQALLLFAPGGSSAPRTVLTADRVSLATWEPNDAAVWAVTATGATEQVAVVPVTGSSSAPVQSVALPVRGPVSSLRLSPDGARAVVVAGAAVWVCRVDRPVTGGRVLSDPRRLAPSVAGVTAVAYDGATVLFASFAGGRVALHRVDLDGYDLVSVRDDGLPAAPVEAIAVYSVEDTSPDRVVSAGGRLWRRSPAARWTPLSGHGAAGTFAG